MSPNIDNNKEHEINYKVFKDCYENINKFRKRHGVRPLQREVYLEQSAQDSANLLSRLEKLEASVNQITKYGEITGRLRNAIKNITGAQLAATWYSTGDHYNYTMEEPVSETKSFTQMIWAASEEIGLGININAKGDVYFVGHFMPKGNILGRFVQNIFPCSTKYCQLIRTTHEMNRIAVERVNYYRGNHNSPQLSIALDHIRSAQNRAEYLVENGNSYSYTEPLSNISESAHIVYSPLVPLIFERIIDKWYNCGQKCDFSFETSDPVTDYFTQLIWKSTKYVGFGHAFKNGNHVFVAHYSPKGNVQSEYQENVEKHK